MTLQFFTRCSAAGILAVLILLCSFAVSAQDEMPAVDTSAMADEVEPRPAAESELEPRATTARTGADLMDLDSTAIRGNQELPKVLYIVPWKDPSLGELVGKPVNSLVDEVIAPVDREVFLRQTTYFDQLYGEPGKGSE